LTKIVTIRSHPADARIFAVNKRLPVFCLRALRSLREAQTSPILKITPAKRDEAFTRRSPF
jgi:hypothetical protein